MSEFPIFFLEAWFSSNKSVNNCFWQGLPLTHLGTYYLKNNYFEKRQIKIAMFPLENLIFQKLPSK